MSLIFRGVLQTGHLLPARDLAHSRWQSAPQQTSHFLLVLIYFSWTIVPSASMLVLHTAQVALEAVDGKHASWNVLVTWDVALSSSTVFQPNWP